MLLESGLDSFFMALMQGVQYPKYWHGSGRSWCGDRYNPSKVVYLFFLDCCFGVTGEQQDGKLDFSV